MKPTEEDQQKAREMVYDWEEVYKPPNLQLFGTRAGLIDRIATLITETRAEGRGQGLEEAANIVDHVRLAVPSQVMAAYINALCDELAAAIRAAAGDEK
jgi:hypothetical protein